MSVQHARNGCSRSPESVFTITRIGVHDGRNRCSASAESVFTLKRNECSRWTGIRITSNANIARRSIYRNRHHRPTSTSRRSGVRSCIQSCLSPCEPLPATLSNYVSLDERVIGTDSSVGLPAKSAEKILPIRMNLPAAGKPCACAVGLNQTESLEIFKCPPDKRCRVIGQAVIDVAERYWNLTLRKSSKDSQAHRRKTVHAHPNHARDVGVVHLLMTADEGAAPNEGKQLTGKPGGHFRFRNVIQLASICPAPLSQKPLN